MSSETLSNSQCLPIGILTEYLLRHTEYVSVSLHRYVTEYLF